MRSRFHWAIAVPVLIFVTRTRKNAVGRTVLYLACHGCASSLYGNFYGGLAIAAGPNAATDANCDRKAITRYSMEPASGSQNSCELAVMTL